MDVVWVKFESGTTGSLHMVCAATRSGDAKVMMNEQTLGIVRAVKQGLTKAVH